MSVFKKQLTRGLPLVQTHMLGRQQYLFPRALAAPTAGAGPLCALVLLVPVSLCCREVFADEALVRCTICVKRKLKPSSMSALTSCCIA